MIDTGERAFHETQSIRGKLLLANNVGQVTFSPAASTVSDQRHQAGAFST